MFFSDAETFNLVITRKGHSEVLLQPDGKSFSLPQVNIPKQRRIAEFITEGVREQWGLEAICLFDPTWEDEMLFEKGQNYQVLEPREPSWIPPATLSWVTRSSINQQGLNSTDQFQALDRSLKLADAFYSGAKPGPFARAGWMDDLSAWMQKHLRPLGFSLTKGFKQLNASPFFSLIRFEAIPLAVWFKAVGDPNVHEYEITQRLAENYPAFLPTVIATKPEWHGWLMADVDGSNLRDAGDLEDWELAVRTLASFQINLIGRSEWLLNIGCKDWRLPLVLDEIDPFLESMVEVMRRQPKTPPEILTKTELLELGRKLKDACHRLQSVQVPDSLLHGDVNPGNIWVTPDDHCVFLDWAEACVGHPFITFEHLLANLRRMHPGLTTWEESLRRTYAMEWKTAIPSRQISQAMLLTPLIAVLSYAVAGNIWRDPVRLNEPNCAKHLRSLTRRLNNEIKKLEDPCRLSGLPQ